MEGYTVCGGLKVDSTSTSCTTFSSGQWVTSHALAEKRDSSCSWATGAGSDILLLGGSFVLDTTETVSEGEYEGQLEFTMERGVQ